MPYNWDFMDLQQRAVSHGNTSIRLVALLCAALAIAAGPGCTATGPVEENAPLFTMEEMVSATQKAAQNAWAAGKRVAEAEFAKERKLIDMKIEKAVQRGRVEGDAQAVERIEAERIEAEKATAAKAAEIVAARQKLFTTTPLFGERKLRTDKNRTISAGQLVEVLHAQLGALGYRFAVSVPYKETKAIRNYDQQKILLMMSSEFNEAFWENLQKMSVMDGLNMLNKLYGFSAWFAHDAKAVWVGLPASPPTPLPNTRIELYFNEKEFMGRVK